MFFSASHASYRTISICLDFYFVLRESGRMYMFIIYKKSAFKVLPDNEIEERTEKFFCSYRCF